MRALAVQLRGADADGAAIARRCFEWVRDRIPHTADHKLIPISVAASDVLALGTGFCYSKSHLLAALLRANGIPAGLVYQRLAIGDGSFCLHGLNAAWIPEFGWYRLDARGRRADLIAEFAPPQERLPFPCSEPGEACFPGIWAEPAAVVVQALRSHANCTELLKHLPDAQDLGRPDLAMNAWARNG